MDGSECLICSRRMEASQLKTHICYHFDYKPYRCSFCGGKFHNIDFLQSHSLEYGHLPLKYETVANRAANAVTGAIACYCFERSRPNNSAVQLERLRQICVDLWKDHYVRPEVDAQQQSSSGVSASSVTTVNFDLLALLNASRSGSITPEDGFPGNLSRPESGDGPSASAGRIPQPLLLLPPPHASTNSYHQEVGIENGHRAPDPSRPSGANTPGVDVVPLDKDSAVTSPSSILNFADRPREDSVTPEHTAQLLIGYPQRPSSSAYPPGNRRMTSFRDTPIDDTGAPGGRRSAVEFGTTGTATGTNSISASSLSVSSASPADFHHPPHLPCMICKKEGQPDKTHRWHHGPIDHALKHMSDATEKSLFQCDLCSFKTNYRRSLRRHFTQTHKLGGGGGAESGLGSLSTYLQDLDDIWPDFLPVWNKCYPSHKLVREQFDSFVMESIEDHDRRSSSLDGTLSRGDRSVSPVAKLEKAIVTRSSSQNTASQPATSAKNGQKCRACGESFSPTAIKDRLRHTWDHISNEDNVKRYRCLLCEGDLVTCNDMDEHLKQCHPDRQTILMGQDAIDRGETHVKLVDHMWRFLWNEDRKKPGSGDPDVSSDPNNLQHQLPVTQMEPKSGSTVNSALVRVGSSRISGSRASSSERTVASLSIRTADDEPANGVKSSGSEFSSPNCRFLQPISGNTVDGTMDACSLQDIEDLREPPVCEICKSVMSAISATPGYSLRSHVLEHVMADTQIKLYVCGTCNAGFRSKKSAKMHFARKSCSDPLLCNLKFVLEPFKETWKACFPQIRCKTEMLFREDMFGSAGMQESPAMGTVPGVPPSVGSETMLDQSDQDQELPIFTETDTPDPEDSRSSAPTPSRKGGSKKRKKRFGRYRFTPKPRRTTVPRVAWPSKPDTETVDKSGKLKCRLCKDNRAHEDLAQHARWHLNNDPSVKFRCLLCHKIFAKITPGKVHLRFTHKAAPEEKANWTWVGGSTMGTMKRCFPGAPIFSMEGQRPLTSPGDANLDDSYELDSSPPYDPLEDPESKPGCSSRSATADDNRAPKYFKCLTCVQKFDRKTVLREHLKEQHNVLEPVRKQHYTVKRVNVTPQPSSTANKSAFAGALSEIARKSDSQGSTSVENVTADRRPIGAKAPAPSLKSSSGNQSASVHAFEAALNAPDRTSSPTKARPSSGRDQKPINMKTSTPLASPKSPTGVLSSADEATTPAFAPDASTGEFICEHCGSGWRTLRSMNMHKSFSHADIWVSRKRRAEMAAAAVAEKRGAGTAGTTAPVPIVPGHIEQDASGRFLCDVCGSAWNSVTSMKKHRVCHVNKKAASSASGSSSGLKIQQSLGSPAGATATSNSASEAGSANDKSPDGGNRLFSCSICGMEFPSLRSLQRHKFSNHQDYLKTQSCYGVCIYCDMAFISKRTLVNHLRHMHRVFSPIIGLHFKKADAGETTSGSGSEADANGTANSSATLMDHQGNTDGGELLETGSIDFVDEDSGLFDYSSIADLKSEMATGQNGIVDHPGPLENSHESEDGLVDPLSFINSPTSAGSSSSAANIMSDGLASLFAKDKLPLKRVHSIEPAKQQKAAKLHSFLNRVARREKTASPGPQSGLKKLPDSNQSHFDLGGASAAPGTTFAPMPKLKFEGSSGVAVKLNHFPSDLNDLDASVEAELPLPVMSQSDLVQPAMQASLVDMSQKICSLCSFVVSGPKEETAHVWKHAREKYNLSLVACAICAQPFATESIAKEHVRASHDIHNRPEAHVKLRHTAYQQEYSEVAEFCFPGGHKPPNHQDPPPLAKIGLAPGSNNRAAANEEEGEVAFCGICLTSVPKCDLQDHVWDHTGIRRVQCVQCPHAACSILAMQRHSLASHPTNERRPSTIASHPTNERRPSTIASHPTNERRPSYPNPTPGPGAVDRFTLAQTTPDMNAQFTETLARCMSTGSAAKKP